MKLVQLLLTTEQVEQIEGAVRTLVERADELGLVFRDEVEKRAYMQLAGFFQDVVDEPDKYAPRGEMARTVKSIVRRAKGPAQPKTAAPKRTQGQQKRDRKLKRELVAEFNAARERIERELSEASAE